MNDRNDSISEPLIVRDGVVSLWGYGVTIGVSRGHLVLTDGFADERRTLRLSKADRPRRITVVVESGGSVSFDAIRWLTNTDTSSLVLLSRGGVVLAAIGPRRLDDTKLRRAQALAVWSGADVSIARHVLATKVAGQARVLARDGAETGASFEPVSRLLAQSADRIAGAASLDEMLILESAAATTYWSAIATLRVTFARASAQRVPDRWKTFGPRSSPLTRGNRRAVTVGNAMLNFVYALLEAEVTIALAAVGLDPGIGVVHADADTRASFALDVMEALRPHVDRIVLDTIARRAFSHTDVVELTNGEVRLAPAFALGLARSLSFEKPVAFAVSEVVRILETVSLPDRRVLLAPKVDETRKLRAASEMTKKALAQGKRLAVEVSGRPRRSGALRIREAAHSTTPPGRVAFACRRCGVTIERRRRPHVCADCRPAHDAEVLADSKTRIAAAGTAAIARANRSGAAPHHQPAAIAKKRVSASRAAIAKRDWVDDGSLARVDFTRDVLPRIADVPVLRIARAIGVSKSWAAQMRTGQKPTHRRHWAALIALADSMKT